MSRRPNPDPARAKYQPELARMNALLSALRREHWEHGLTANFLYGKRELERGLGLLFLRAFKRIRGRKRIEKAVLASVFFWDWWGGEWFGKESSVYLNEPAWAHEARLECQDDLMDADDAEIGAGLVLAGYAPWWAANHLVSQHFPPDVVRSPEEREKDEAGLAAEIADRARARGWKI